MDIGENTKQIWLLRFNAWMRLWVTAAVRAMVALGLLWLIDTVSRLEPVATRLSRITQAGASRDSSLSPEWWILIVAAILGFVTSLSWTRHTSSFAHACSLLAKSFAAPRPFVQAFIAVGFLTLCTPMPLPWRGADFFSILVAMSIGVVFALLASGAYLTLQTLLDSHNRDDKKWKGKPASIRPGTIEEATERWDEIFAWSQHDDPIRTGPDWFQLSAKAVQVFNRMTEPSRRPFDIPCFQLLGPAGSGKTSLCNLLSVRLLEWHRSAANKSSHITIANLSTWHYADRFAIYRAVLRTIIATLDCHVSTLGGAGLPAAYAQAIASSDKLFGALATGTIGDAEPSELIRRLSDLAVAADVCIVVWIDDSERLTMLSDDDAAAIASLLRLLRDAPALSFVLARSPELSDHPVVDAAKVVDYTEYLRVDAETIAVFLGALRRRCLGYLSEKHLVDPPDPGRQRLLEAFGSRAFRILLHDSESVFGALISLVDSPRQLKMVIRRVWSAWERGGLAGEIDIDNLILYHALRESSAPPLSVSVNGEPVTVEWRTLLADPHFAKIGDETPRREGGLDRGETIYSAISAKIDSLTRLSNPALVVLQALLKSPGYFHVQGFQGDGSAEYIQRAAEERCDPDRLDQPPLRRLTLILTAAPDEQPPLLAQLAADIIEPENEQLRGGLSRFQRLLSTAQWTQLARIVGTTIADHPGATVGTSGDRNPAILFFAQLLRAHADTSLIPLARPSAVSAMRKGALSLAYELCHWWGPETKYANPDDRKWWRETSSELCDAFCSWAEEAEPDAVAAVAATNPIWSLSWLAQQLWVQNEDLRPPIEIWQPAIPLLLRAAEADPQPIARLLAVFAARVTDGPIVEEDEFGNRTRGYGLRAVAHEEPLVRLCPPEYLDAIWELLSRLDASQGVGKQETETLTKARDLAKEKLKDNKGHQPTTSA